MGPAKKRLEVHIALENDARALQFAAEERLELAQLSVFLNSRVFPWRTCEMTLSWSLQQCAGVVRPVDAQKAPTKLAAPLQVLRWASERLRGERRAVRSVLLPVWSLPSVRILMSSTGFRHVVLTAIDQARTIVNLSSVASMSHRPPAPSVQSGRTHAP